MDKKIGTIEMVKFQLKSDVSAEHGRIQLEKLTACASKFPGFVGRNLSQDAKSNEWLDLVYWDKLESAQYAAQEIMKDPTAMEIFGVIDDSTMHMQHWNVEHTSELTPVSY